MLIQNWLQALFYVFLTSTSILGYSRLLSLKFKNLEKWTSIVLTLGILCSVFVLTGIVLFKSWLQPIVLFAGIFFFRFSFLKFPKILFSNRDKIFLFFPVLFFSTRFISAGLPQQHNDALYYHLYAIKEWVDAGKIFLTSNHPSFAQATFFEMLYSIPQFFSGTSGSSAHVTSQIYAQWMHLIWGQMAVWFLAYAFFKKLVDHEKIHRACLLFFAFLVTTIPCVEWTGGLAKNDYVVALFALSAVFVLLENKSESILFAGIFAGFAFSTKMSSLCTLIALPILLGNFKNYFKYSIGVFIGIFAIILRNIVLTRNPMFPMFDEVIGPHMIANWWVRHNASFSGFFKFDPAMLPWMWQKLFEKALPRVLLFAVLAGFIQRKKWQTKWLIFSIIQLVLIVSMLRPETDARYAGYSLTLIFILFISNVIPYLFSTKIFKYASALSVLGLLLNSPVDLFFKVPFKYLFADSHKYVLEFHAYQEMKDWMNDHLEKDAVVLAIADKANFYLDRKTITMTESKEWEDLTNSSYDQKDFLKKIKAKGIRYVFLQTHFVYPDSLARFWDELMRDSIAVTRFKTQSTLLLDLSLLN